MADGRRWADLELRNFKWAVNFWSPWLHGICLCSGSGVTRRLSLSELQFVGKLKESADPFVSTLSALPLADLQRTSSGLTAGHKDGSHVVSFLQLHNTHTQTHTHTIFSLPLPPNSYDPFSPPPVHRNANTILKPQSAQRWNEFALSGSGVQFPTRSTIVDVRGFHFG